MPSPVAGELPASVVAGLVVPLGQQQGDGDVVLSPSIRGAVDPDVDVLREVELVLIECDEGGVVEQPGRRDAEVRRALLDGDLHRRVTTDLVEQRALGVPRAVEARPVVDEHRASRRTDIALLAVSTTLDRDRFRLAHVRRDVIPLSVVEQISLDDRRQARHAHPSANLITLPPAVVLTDSWKNSLNARLPPRNSRITL